MKVKIFFIENVAIATLQRVICVISSSCIGYLANKKVFARQYKYSMANVDCSYKCKYQDIEYKSRLYKEQEIKRTPLFYKYLSSKIKKMQYNN